MWFKTRVALVNIKEASEILIGRSDGGAWFIYARSIDFPDITIKRFMGNKISTSGGKSIFLAMFLDGPQVQKRLGDAMSLIASAIESKAAICGLSQTGDDSGWSSAWNKIAWQESSSI